MVGQLVLAIQKPERKFFYNLLWLAVKGTLLSVFQMAKTRWPPTIQKPDTNCVRKITI
jgi:hypothetical protein